MFDYKHLIAIIIKPSFFKNSFFSLAFHELYFKISKISLIKPLLNLKKFIFINENDGIFFKIWSIGKVTDGQNFKMWASVCSYIGQHFDMLAILLLFIINFF